MASEERDSGAVSFAVPRAVDSWIDEQARRRGETRDEFCRRILAAVHAASSTDEADPIDPIERAELEELTTRVDGQRREFVDLLEDVRERVIQVKREADGKAPADHDHPEHATGADLRDLRRTLDRLESELAELRKTTDDGFEDAETILGHLIAETDELEERSAVLATSVVELREFRDEQRRRERRRAEAERLQVAANQLGIRRAACDACSSSVTIGLLTRPECPHCEQSFADVEKKTSLFGSHTLVTGEPPALEGAVEPNVGRGVGGEREEEEEEEGSGAAIDDGDGVGDADGDDRPVDRTADPAGAAPSDASTNRTATNRVGSDE